MKAPFPERPVVRLRPELAEQVVGIPIAADEQRRRLERLGFEVADDWTVRVPAWRARDVRREIDLVEEVARFRLEEVPPTMPERTEMFGRLSHEQRLRRRGLRPPRRLRLRRGVHVLAAAVRPGSGRPDAAGAAVRAAARAADDAALRPRRARHSTTSTSATPTWRCSRSRTSTCRPTGRSPREPWRLGGIVRGGFFRAKGSSRRSSRCSRRSRASRRRRTRSWPRPRAHPCREAGWRSSTRACSRASGRRSSSTWPSCSPRCRSGSSTRT